MSPFSCMTPRWNFFRLDQVPFYSICYAHNNTQTPYRIGISWTSSSRRIYLYTYGSVLHCTCRRYEFWFRGAYLGRYMYTYTLFRSGLHVTVSNLAWCGWTSGHSKIVDYTRWCIMAQTEFQPTAPRHSVDTTSNCSIVTDQVINSTEYRQ